MLTLGRYTLDGEIAAGGMASVHLARLAGPAGFARIVAAKRLHPHIARDREVALAFAAEARLVSRIRHPNVVPTLDVVEVGDELVIIMEYVHGESLARLAALADEQGVRLPLPVVLAALVDTLHGLHAAHEARDESGASLGIVHRDVSPQNVLVGIDGIARVLDFGIAKAAGRLFTTRDGVTKGKLAYMAPEQAYGEAVTPATDVFAASIVLWELLCGRRLFAGQADADTVHNVLYKVPEPPSRHRDDVSAALDALVLRGLARDPSDRFPSARAMADALEAVGTAARPSEVGRWVARLAAEPLAARARGIATLEAAARDGGGLGAGENEVAPADAEAGRAPMQSPASSSPEALSQHLLVTTVPEPAREPAAEPTADKPTIVVRSLLPTSVPNLIVGARGGSRPWRTRAAALALLAGMAGLAFSALADLRARGPKGQAPERPAPASAAASMALEAAAGEAAPGEPSLAPLLVAHASATGLRGAADISDGGVDAESASALSAPASSGSPPRPARGGAKRTDGCTPPYVVTSKGHVVFKDECF